MLLERTHHENYKRRGNKQSLPPEKKHFNSPKMFRNLKQNQLEKGEYLISKVLQDWQLLRLKKNLQS
jgi:hypothetical protein